MEIMCGWISVCTHTTTTDVSYVYRVRLPKRHVLHFDLRKWDTNCLVPARPHSVSVFVAGCHCCRHPNAVSMVNYVCRCSAARNHEQVYQYSVYQRQCVPNVPTNRYCVCIRTIVIRLDPRLLVHAMAIGHFSPALPAIVSCCLSLWDVYDRDVPQRPRSVCHSIATNRCEPMPPTNASPARHRCHCNRSIVDCRTLADLHYQWRSAIDYAMQMPIQILWLLCVQLKQPLCVCAMSIGK